MSSGVAKLSRISFNSGSNSVRPMPRENAAQSLNSRPSNSCITTKGTKRLVLKAAPISLAKSWSRGHYTKRQKSYAKEIGSLVRGCKGSQRSEGTFPEPSCSLPGVVTGQVDVLPADG